MRFLKTLEESAFIPCFISWTTEKHKIIRDTARGQIFWFQPIGVDDLQILWQVIAEKRKCNCKKMPWRDCTEGWRSLTWRTSMFDQLVSFWAGNNLYLKRSLETEHPRLRYILKSPMMYWTGIFIGTSYFNEIINNGFDSHNFIMSGLHCAELLVCKMRLRLNFSK